jgi:transcriptional regulator with XRE-family HTH domain
MTFLYQTPEWLKKTRKGLGLNQAEFWHPVGVTQSAGSRYESGRDVPDSVRMLLAIAYGTEPQRFEALKHASQRSSERVIISREVSGVTQRLTQRGGLYSLNLDDGKQRQVHSQDSVLRTLANSWFKEALQGGEPAKPAPVPTESAPSSGGIRAGEMFVLVGGEKPEKVRYFVHGDLEVHRVTLRKTHYTGHVSFEFAGVLLTYKNEDATEVLFENEDDARAQLQLNKIRYYVSEGGKITQVIFDGEDEDDVFFIADGFCHRIPKHAAAVKLYKSLGAAEKAVAASRLLLGE